MNCWLMKSEPEVFSVDDLKAAPRRTTLWEGVRNYQARNFMRDAMRKGDPVLFYHSNCTVPGIVGLAEIASDKAYPDPTQFDPASPYFDPRATRAKPRWLVVDVRYRKRLQRPLSLAAIKEHPVLRDMLVARRGMRLSIQPVSAEHHRLILAECGG
jgi:predicted RNA-binding protein with PUA-like domain